MDARNKHAYLILCHTDFSLLCLLIRLLDDERNDIYIHIDRKLNLGNRCLNTKKAGLCVLEQRFDARWGDYSLVQVELMLFETASSKGCYAYYHLLSGADLPLKSQDYIHEWCDRNAGVELVGFSGTETDQEAKWRACHRFLFPRRFRSNSIFIRLVRRVFLSFQDIVPLSKMRSIEVKKGPQWVSVTHDFVSYLLQNRTKVEELFAHTYCPDELFVQTVCWNSPFRQRVFDVKHEFAGCMRYIPWRNGVLLDMTVDILYNALASDCWFARKFNSKQYEILNILCSHLGLSCFVYAYTCISHSTYI